MKVFVLLIFSLFAQLAAFTALPRTSSPPRWIFRTTTCIQAGGFARSEKGTSSPVKVSSKMTPTQSGTFTQNSMKEAIKFVEKRIAEIESGLADVDGLIGQQFQLTPLHCAAGGGQVSFVGRLIDKGASLDCQDNDGSTPLLMAAHKGHADVGKALIDGGANLELQDKNGFTALHAAAVRGYTTLVKMLIDNSASVDCQTNDGSTPLLLLQIKDIPTLQSPSSPVEPIVIIKTRTASLPYMLLHNSWLQMKDIPTLQSPSSPVEPILIIKTRKASLPYMLLRNI